MARHTLETTRQEFDSRLTALEERNRTRRAETDDLLKQFRELRAEQEALNARIDAARAPAPQPASQASPPAPSPAQRSREADHAAFLAARDAAIAEAKATGRTATMKEWRS